MIASPYAPEVYVTLKGMKNQVAALARQANAPIVEIDPDLPYFIQLMDIDPRSELVIALSDRINKQRSLEFRDKIFRTNAARKIYRQTYLYNSWVWGTNALTNRERFLAGHLITDLKKRSDAKVAIVVGNGPSLKSFTQPVSNAEIFTCWHALSKLQANNIDPNYVMHIDVAPPSQDFEITALPASTPIIATPTAAPQFLEQYSENPLYGYFSQEVVFHSWFAKQRNIAEHEAIDGTVVTGMVRAAIYAGYRNIALIGVDLGDPVTGNKDEVILEKNQFGHEISTSPVYMTYKEGLEYLASSKPEVRFYNLSQIGLDLAGFKPVTWDGLLTLQ